MPVHSKGADEKSVAIDNALDGLFSHELRRTSVGVAAALADMLAPLDLRASEASMLIVIGDNPGCTQSDIGRSMRAQAANLVPIIQRLESEGLLERTPGEGRTIQLQLSKSGAKKFAQVRDVFARFETKLTRGMSKAQQTQAVSALRLLLKNACCD